MCQEAMKKIAFRNYAPRSEVLKKYVVNIEPADKDWERWEGEFKGELADAEARFANPESDLEILAPKKVNWDLKQQLAPKVRVLQRRTHNALLQIVRDKLAASGGEGPQLAHAVANPPALGSDDEEDDDADDDDDPIVEAVSKK